MTLDRIDHLPKFVPPLNLDRITSLLKLINLLNPGFSWIHVAGTKGKGSTSVFLSNILLEANYRVGLFLSPHLCDPNERVSIQMKPVSRENLETISGNLDMMLEKNFIHDFSFFEYWTLLALLIFKENHTDVAVIETGLGGRLDATNAIQNPILSIITLIGRDHVDRLGLSVEEIAREKAGIIKQSIPVLSAKQLPSVEEIIIKEANEHQCRYYSTYRDYEISYDKSLGFEPGKMNVLSYLSGIAYSNLTVSLLGKHQLENASLALAAIEILSKKGYCVDEKIIRHGLKSAFIPGRMEKISYKDRIILLDGAHNPESFHALVEAIKERFPGKKLTTMFGSLKNKLIEENLLILSEVALKIWIAEIPGHDSFTNSDRIFQSNLLAVSDQLSPDRILEEMIQTSKSGEMLLITGSLYLVGWIRKHILPGQKIIYRISEEA